MQSIPKNLTVIILGLTLMTILGYAEESSHETAARAFVEKCLKDPNIFIYNPLATMKPYKDMSRAEKICIMQKAMKDGSVLHLYLNGMPASFISYKNSLKHGLQKKWYPDGKIKFEENIKDGKLLTGSYFNDSGIMLSQIENGKGKRVLFDRPMKNTRAKIIGFANYKNGVKEGLEILYRDYEKGLKFKESHYRDAKLHGTMTKWMSGGQKNIEQNYRDGFKHGKSTGWYRNGQIRSTSNYIDGKQVGPSVRYYENGKKAKEGGKRWYPSGTLMLYRKFGENHVLEKAESYDLFGNLTGKVETGIGSLVEKEEYEEYYLEIYEKNYNEYYSKRRIKLPQLSMYGHYSENSDRLGFRLSTTAPANANIEKLDISLILPEGCTSNDKLNFCASDVKSGYEIQFDQVSIILPQPYREWSDKIMADIQVLIDGHTARYQQIAWKKQERDFATLPKVGHKTRKYWFKHNVKYWEAKCPVVKDEILPPYNQALSALSYGEKYWLLYSTPPVLLTSEDSPMRNNWTIIRDNIPYYPKGMFFLPKNRLFIWGIKKTNHPENGIPYIIEESNNGGKSWSQFKIPDVDYLLDISTTDTNVKGEKIVTVSCIHLPKDGIPAEKDWFELPRTHFISKDGKTFMEFAGPSFFDIGRIIMKSVAPNGKYRVYVEDTSFLDPSYIIYISKSPDDIPMKVFSSSTKGTLIWSENSKILALKHGNKFFAYVDVETGEYEVSKSAFDESQKDKDLLAEFDKKIHALFVKNSEGKK
ncbi:MAG: toxin-antitoxin system YwqK family antitoxin [Candidatus Aureabacteria bacterium]|nr:toxin-antitoxin system YwqK family antitoxin [Candidatus Auribacterota bacterium]